MAETATLDPAQDESTTEDLEDQHLRALRHANRVRLARAEMKRRIRAGQLAVVEVILNCPWEAYSMEISDLLMSQNRWGLARCKRVLSSSGVPENKQIGTLTERQRVALVSAFSTA
jgi:hypothetical protein